MHGFACYYLRMTSASKPSFVGTPAKKSGDAEILNNAVASSKDSKRTILPSIDEQQPIQTYKAHWHIFVPTVVICILYILGWITLYFLGKSGGSLARLFIVVLAVGVPLLFAHAFLRYQTISIEIFEKQLRYHTGWPKADPVVVPYGLIEKVQHSRGLSGRLFGGGTVILQLVAGEAVGVADVEKPIEAQEKIAAMM